MKVSYTFDIFSQQVYGGVSRYFTELFRHLLPLDVDIEVFAGAHICKLLQAEPYVRGYYFPVGGPSRFRNCFNLLYQSMSADRRNGSLFHQTYLSKLLKGKAKVVVTIHDMIDELGLIDRSHYADTIRKRAACERADAILAVSQQTKDDLVRIFKVDPEKIHVVYHGISISTFSRSLQNEALNCRPYIFYVGSRHSYKNFTTLLRAFSDNVFLRKEFNIVCFGGGSFSSQEISDFCTLGIADRVFNYGGDDDTLFHLYKGASALICPSLYEGFGLPIIEAMAIGCPVACSFSGSLPEIAGSAAEYFEPRSAEDIAVSLIKVLTNSQRREELINLGFARASQFSWSKCAQETKKVYTSLLC